MIQRTSTAVTDENGNIVGLATGWGGFISEEQKTRFQEFRRNGGVDPEEFYRMEKESEAKK